MHVGVMSVLQLYCLASINHVKLSLVLANVQLARAAVRELKRSQDQRKIHNKRLKGKQTDPQIMDGSVNFL